MNRTIKFRAWDVTNNIMIHPAASTNETYLVFEETVWFVVDHFTGKNETILKSEDGILMQFTGLLDKYGKEIYEGDLMRVLDRDWPSGDGDPHEHMRSIASICEVVYDVDRFSLVKRKKGYSDENLDQTYGRDLFEVIGNIYENPDFLQK